MQFTNEDHAMFLVNVYIYARKQQLEPDGTYFHTELLCDACRIRSAHPTSYRLCMGDPRLHTYCHHCISSFGKDRKLKEDSHICITITCASR